MAYPEHPDTVIVKNRFTYGITIKVLNPNFLKKSVIVMSCFSLWLMLTNQLFDVDYKTSLSD